MKTYIKDLQEEEEIDYSERSCNMIKAWVVLFFVVSWLYIGQQIFLVSNLETQINKQVSKTSIITLREDDTEH